MSGVFQNIDPPHPPHHPASLYPPPLVRGEDTLAGWRGGGVNILEDARHRIFLYTCKSFVLISVLPGAVMSVCEDIDMPTCS
jgi:hypothetical protein